MAFLLHLLNNGILPLLLLDDTGLFLDLGKVDSLFFDPLLGLVAIGMFVLVLLVGIFDSVAEVPEIADVSFVGLSFDGAADGGE